MAQDFLQDEDLKEFEFETPGQISPQNDIVVLCRSNSILCHLKRLVKLLTQNISLILKEFIQGM